MKSKWLLISCYLLTIVVVTTACRIEYLNIHSGYFLPRNPATVGNWIIPELDEVLERLDYQIYERRQNFADAEAIENGSSVTAEVSLGAPYSASEQRTLDSMKNLHASHSYLQWWVYSFGTAQYLLAPAALIAAIICCVSLGGWGFRSSAAFCACLNVGSIVLMFTRNYWNA
jgi:hypothetical protein